MADATPIAETDSAALQRLHINNGDILILRPGGETAEDVEACRDRAEQLRRVLYGRNVDNVTILIVPKGAELDKLAEPDMLAAGWVRSTTVSRNGG